MSFTGTADECAEWMRAKRLESLDAPTFEVRVRRRSRTLTQNAYYWALVNRLSSALRISADECHEQLLRQYGVHDAFSVDAGVPVGDYFAHWEEIGRGTVDGRPVVHIRAMKGSSRMDAAEFGRLLDGAIYECGEQGIETMPPAQAAALRFAEPGEGGGSKW